MKKIIAFCLLVICVSSVAIAQKKNHRIVFEITSADTSQQKTTLRQIHNVLRDVPGTKVELVCHGPAIFMLVKAKTILEEDMQQLKNNGVMEVVTKEEEGWSYIKAGD